MSFLFGKKKGAHNREGTPTGPGSAGSAIQTTPSSSANQSWNSLQGSEGSPGNRSAASQGASRAHQSQNSDGTTPSPQAGRMLQQTSPPGSQVSSNASLYPWSQRRLSLSSSHPSPFPRYGHAANAVSSKDGDVYIMGGLIRSQNVRGDLWMIEGGNERLEAYPVLTTSEGPGPRVGHASLLVGNAFIVFGGDTKLDERDVLDETLYLLNTSTRQWSRASPHGHRPSGRYGHTLNILGSKLYIFGGQVDTVFFNDLAAFDLNTLQHVGSKWEVLVPATEGSADVPASRTNHTIVTWNDKLYLFGGTNGMEWFNDVWSYDPRTNQWTQLDCIGFIPSPREGHAASLVNDVMYIFGGRSSEGSDLGDLAAFRISSRRWYTFQNMGPSPSPRSGHSMTTAGTKIIVLGGEPSVPARTPEELQLIYVLDTAKIRYPNDNPSQVSPTGPNRTDPRRIGQGTGPGMRNGSIDSAGPGPESRGPPKRGPRESIMGPGGQPVVSPNSGGPSPLSSNNTSGGANSRLPRASIATQPAGPPPTQQAPPPRGPNGPVTGPHVTPGKPVGPLGPNGQPVLSGPQYPRGKENSGPANPQREDPTNGTRTPTSQRNDSKDSIGSENARLRQHQGQESIDSTNGLSVIDEKPQNPQSQPSSESHEHQDRSTSTMQFDQRPVVDVRSPSDQPTVPESHSPVHESTLIAMKEYSKPHGRKTGDVEDEIEKLRRTNEWYSSELALARRAGYTPQNANSALLDDRGIDLLPENDRPFIEAMLAMKGELAKVQSQVDTQAALAAKKVQDIERQRDIAIQEAVYAKAKLAALGGPSTPTPGDKSTDMAAIDAEKMTDMSRKLAASLTAQADFSVKVEVLTQEIAAERKARYLADETASAAQSRISELDEYRNWAGSEIENLRAELLDAGKAFRDEAALGQEAAAEVKLLRIDQEEFTSRLQDALDENKNFKASLEHMSKAIQVTGTKNATLERQLEEERVVKEGLERKLAQVKSEYEEKTADLNSLNKRLKDMEELTETYSEEAKAANAVLTSGLDKLNEREASDSLEKATEERVRVLQEQVENTKVLLSKSKAQADETGEKLAEAMQRIAGLEYQQGQSSKDSIALRRRMAEVSDEGRNLKAENAELQQRVNNKQLEADAVTAKHNALREILHERSASGMNGVYDKRRSFALQSPSPGSGTATPEQISRLRDLEQRLEESLRAHRETKSTAEMQAQEVEKHFREKLEQLEHDYQSAVHYVKGTEKMLKRMKDELAKFKVHNAKLQVDLEEAQHKGSKQNEARTENEADWEQERELLSQEIDDLRQKVRESATALDKQIRETKIQLDTLRDERDQLMIEHNQFKLQLLDNSQKMSAIRGQVEKLESENALLETRAEKAEEKVSLMLDQMESSVDQYRRSSRLDAGNGEPYSTRSSYYGGTGSGLDNRTSVALDSLATELDALRTHWETNKSYRISTNFDFDKTSSSPQNTEFSSSIAQWRQKLQQEEESAARSSNGSRQDVVSPVSPTIGSDSRNGTRPIMHTTAATPTTPTPTPTPPA